MIKLKRQAKSALEEEGLVRSKIGCTKRLITLSLDSFSFSKLIYKLRKLQGIV